MSVVRLSSFALAAALIACTPADKDDPASSAAPAVPAPAVEKTRKVASTATHWRCGDLDITTRFDEISLDSLTLTHSGQTLTLEPVANEREGARFADDAGNAFWSRPGQVDLALVGRTAVSCAKRK